MVCRMIRQHQFREERGLQQHLRDAAGAAGSYLVRQSEGELDLVRGDLSVSTALDGAGDGGRARAEGGAGNAEGAHDEWRGGEDAIAGAAESFNVVEE